jgi:hypothetical protein
VLLEVDLERIGRVAKVPAPIIPASGVNSLKAPLGFVSSS